MTLFQTTIDISGQIDQLPSGGSTPTIQFDLGTLIATFVGTGLIVGGLATLIFMLMAGVKWITGSGDPGKVEKARNEFIQAIIGLAVLASIWAVFMVVQGFFAISILGSLAGGALA